MLRISPGDTAPETCDAALTTEPINGGACGLVVTIVVTGTTTFWVPPVIVMSYSDVPSTPVVPA